MSDPTNKIGQPPASDIAGPAFYSAEEQTVIEREDHLQRESTIGRSAEEVARDPANLAGALMLPLLTEQEYKAFLENGLKWFEQLQVDRQKEKEALKVTDEFNERMHKIIIGMLDAWADSIKAIEEMKKRYENSPLRLMLDEELKKLKSGEEGDRAAPMSVATLMILMSVGGVGGEVESLKPFAQAWEVMAPFATVPFVASDMRAELGLIGAFYATMAQMQVAVMRPAIEKLAQEQNIKESGKELAAKSYAAVVAKEVLNPSFSLFLEHIVLAKLGAAATLQDKEVLGAKVKLVLLMTALALLYKTETGKVTAEEVAGLLKGEIPLETGDLKTVLIALIKGHISLMPQGQREQILNAILEYIGGDPPVEELLSPSEVFRGLLGTSTFAPVKDQAI